MIVLGPFFVALVVGLFFHCAVRALVLLIQYGREPELDELDFDNAHPDGFIRHFAADKREVL